MLPAMKTLIAVLLGTSPVVLHLAIVWSSRPLMILFLAIVATGLLAAMARRRLSPWATVVAALGMGAFGMLDIATAARIASAWPIVVYLATAYVFGRTLRPGRTPLIERLARALDYTEGMPAEIVAYTRRLTWAWTIIPAAMALGSLLLAEFASRAAWSLFSNVLGYFALMALFFAEYPYRRWRYPDTPHTNPVAVAVRLARRAPEFLRPQGRHPG
jgi:uncharacterized membrane protein